jgi:hypothetical protein
MQNAGANFQLVYKRWNFWNNHAVATGHGAYITVVVPGVNTAAEGYSAPPISFYMGTVLVLVVLFQNVKLEIPQNIVCPPSVGRPLVLRSLRHSANPAANCVIFKHVCVCVCVFVPSLYTASHKKD